MWTSVCVCVRVCVCLCVFLWRKFFCWLWKVYVSANVEQWRRGKCLLDNLLNASKILFHNIDDNEDDVNIRRKICFHQKSTFFEKNRKSYFSLLRLSSKHTNDQAFKSRWTRSLFHQLIGAKPKYAGVRSLAQSVSPTKLCPTLKLHTTIIYTICSTLYASKISVNLLAQKLLKNDGEIGPRCASEIGSEMKERKCNKCFL